MFSCSSVGGLGGCAITRYRSFAALAPLPQDHLGVQGCLHKACDTPPSRPRGRKPPLLLGGSATANRDRTAASLTHQARSSLLLLIRP